MFSGSYFLTLPYRSTSSYCLSDHVLYDAVFKPKGKLVNTRISTSLVVGIFDNFLLLLFLAGMWIRC